MSKEDAFQKAVRFLGRRAHSRRELERKLEQRRYEAAEIEEALEKLAALGYLNDAEFAASRAEQQRTRKLWGDLRIRKDLQRLGIAKNTIEETLGHLEQDHPQARSLARLKQRWLERKGVPETISEIESLFRRISRLGYPSYLVRESLQEFFRKLDRSERS